MIKKLKNLNFLRNCDITLTVEYWFLSILLDDLQPYIGKPILVSRSCHNFLKIFFIFQSYEAKNAS
jgi:hypothetical protein